MNAQELSARLKGATQRGEKWMACCPAHEDTSPSLSFRDGTKGIVLTCLAGCSLDAICAQLKIGLHDLFFDGNGATHKQIVATYDYTDAAGTLLYQVVRYESKEFRQRRPDGHGGFIWNLKGVTPVPYRLPQLQDEPHLWCVEGEKDADRLWALGLPATCNSGGAGKWTDAHTQQLLAAGVQAVSIPPDNDEPGERHAQAVARSHAAAGITVKIVRLPNLPDKGDVSNFLDAGGTKEVLLALGDAAPVWTPDATAQASDETEARADRPALDCDEKDLYALTVQTWRIVAACNTPIRLYRRGTMAIRLEEDEHRHVRVVELTDARLRFEVSRLAQCVKGSSGEDCKPPLDLIRNMLATPSHDMPLPMLRGIVEVPVVSPQGRLLFTPGYDADSRLLYRPYDPTTPIQIPLAPTPADLTEARALLDELLIDFLFTSNADRTNNVGVMLLPFLRHFIHGPTPLHLYEAPGPGVGKNLLAEVSLYPAVGNNVGSIADARDDDEMRKRITARLLEGRAITLFDNITRPVDSGVISAAITATQWEDRLLGKTETLSLPVSTVWAMTANNPVLSMELARRAVRIRLDPKVDRPWQRNGFLHSNLKDWMHQERPAFIRAVLILVQGWLVAGTPAPTVQPLGSFESWTRVIGGVLEWAGYTDFLGNALALYETSDTDSMIWRTFTTRWWEAHHDQPVSVKELFLIAKDLDSLYLGKSDTERGQRTALGAQLKKHHEQVFGEYRIEAAGSSNNAALWRLRLMAKQTPMDLDEEPLATPSEVFVDET